MDAPKCRICGKREFNHICAGDGAASDRPARKKKSKSVRPVALLKPGTRVLLDADAFEEIVARLESVEERLAVLEKRKTYNRDYMRRKRAEEKDNG